MTPARVIVIITIVTITIVMPCNMKSPMTSSIPLTDFKLNLDHEDINSLKEKLKQSY